MFAPRTRWSRTHSGWRSHDRRRPKALERFWKSVIRHSRINATLIERRSPSRTMRTYFHPRGMIDRLKCSFVFFEKPGSKLKYRRPGLLVAKPYRFEMSPTVCCNDLAYSATSMLMRATPDSIAAVATAGATYRSTRGSKGLGMMQFRPNSKDSPG